MKYSLFSIPPLSSSRIPQLYFGASTTPRRKTGREKLADRLYISLQIISYILFLVGGITGYLYYQLYGLILFAILGHLIGVWMRRSMGMRGLKPTTGFFMRMRERGLGSKPGLLEWLLEQISRNEFTVVKCRLVTQTYEKAVRQMKQSRSTEEQVKILADLDRSVSKILVEEKET